MVICSRILLNVPIYVQCNMRSYITYYAAAHYELCRPIAKIRHDIYPCKAPSIYYDRSFQITKPAYEEFFSRKKYFPTI